MKINTRDMILVSMFAALMAAGAFMKVLFPVIPFSMQPFFCAFAGIILGARLGALSQIVYVLLGLAGLPIFTQGGGLSYVLNPSFGFLLGFIAGAWFIGRVASLFREISFKSALLSVLPGLAAIYAIGVPYMYLILRFYMKKPAITFAYAVSVGFTPFIVKDLILYIVVAIVAASAVPALRKANLLNRV